jgi:hypothetical protein
MQRRMRHPDNISPKIFGLLVLEAEFMVVINDNSGVLPALSGM